MPRSSLTLFANNGAGGMLLSPALFISLSYHHNTYSFVHVVQSECLRPKVQRTTRPAPAGRFRFPCPPRMKNPAGALRSAGGGKRVSPTGIVHDYIRLYTRTCINHPSANRRFFGLSTRRSLERIGSLRRELAGFGERSAAGAGRWRTVKQSLTVAPRTYRGITTAALCHRSPR